MNILGIYCLHFYQTFFVDILLNNTICLEKNYYIVNKDEIIFNK